ncbi:PREDICTED: protein PROCA1 isoform X1 [Ceratotherium simum simum]|uniref:Protein PROCA1 isoform X1 n=1 Tax=Ceratotherium simum simum TaxID=73337 RepID=A0ABM0HT55_CERSS|nr:PREDICTED: protein PROCA1 isoform X1 [Ceratotherium simum simum]
MWVRTTLTTERWTTEKTEDDADIWDESSWDINRLPSWERGHLLAGVASSTDASTFSEGEFKDPDRCCWKHKQCTGHIIYPFASAYGHHDLHLHSVNHCDCDSRLKDCSEKTNSSSSRDVGPTCSRDVGSTCFNIIQSPCLELIPEELCVERFWYGWCKSYRPVSVAVIHYPIHHECGADDLNEEEEEEEEEESKPPIPTQVGPTTTPTDTGIGTVTGTPDSAAPITIWRSESPTGKSQGSKVIKKVKKKKEKEKEQEEESDEKAKLKKKAKKSKLSKKKSLVKSESSPPDLSRSISPRELVRMSESSPDSREDLESEDSYNDPRQEEPSSEDIVESSLPRKREKNTVQAKKPRAKASPVKKVTKRKSPPASNPNLS